MTSPMLVKYCWMMRFQVTRTRILCNKACNMTMTFGNILWTAIYLHAIFVSKCRLRSHTWLLILIIKCQEFPIQKDDFSTLEACNPYSCIIHGLDTDYITSWLSGTAFCFYWTRYSVLYVSIQCGSIYTAMFYNVQPRPILKTAQPSTIEFCCYVTGATLKCALLR